MNIRVKITRDGSNTIKTIDLEEYLRCVVPSEIPASWPAEALKAQAVAARTYAMRRIQTRQTKEYDVDDTVAFQAYRIGNEHASTDKAIKDTVNQCLTYNGKIIDAVYSSSNGGRTYSAEERWGGAIAYLISQPDPFNKEAKNGHGVGMSQYGAKHRAEAGHTYVQILQFYYPRTEIAGLKEDTKMDIKQCILTENRCYKAGAQMNPIGIVVHSTGANNKQLRRYLAPDDGIIGKNQYGNHWNRKEATACVNAFIGVGVDNKVYAYQTLPWTTKPWGCGGGSKGSYNNTHIQFEICEDDLTNRQYFDGAFKVAAELCAYLVKEFKMDIKNVVSHAEAHKAGYGSNHGDCDHWLKKFGQTMSDFRAKVQALVGEQSTIPTEPEPIKPEPVPVEFQSYKVRVTANVLNYRSGPGTSYKINGQIKDKGIYTIVEEQNNWGKLKSGAGWISLAYTEVYGQKPSASVPTYKEYVVKNGDSLWRIAKNELGSGARYPEIKELNNLKNNIIHTGDVLKIPNK